MTSIQYGSCDVANNKGLEFNWALYCQLSSTRNKLHVIYLYFSIAIERLFRTSKGKGGCHPTQAYILTMSFLFAFSHNRLCTDWRPLLFRSSHQGSCSLSAIPRSSLTLPRPIVVLSAP
ncbi:Arrestin-related trafficking adapter 3 [Fusarium oxysporum f. sp. albedinis]|nr:Arrestin-related trafficking adapter 3 [Fusarium oxysporum f. sp. albedinis]